MEEIYFILGGVFSWILISSIRFTKQNLKHNFEKKSIERRIQNDNQLAQFYGDVESYLNDSFEYRKSNFINELTLNGLRPLIVLGFAFLFQGSNPITSILLFSTLIFFMVHEFLYAEKHMDNWGYRFLIILIWILFICNILLNDKKSDIPVNGDEIINITDKTEEDNTDKKDAKKE